MIYLFLWENHFRKELISKWKKAFIEKYDELNIFHIQNFSDYDINFYNQNLFSTWFFSSKSLFIIDDFPFWVSNDDKSNIYIDYFLNNLKKIDNENIIIFNVNTADKRSKLYKLIKEVWEIKDFSISDEEDLVSKLSKIYSDSIDYNILKQIVSKKWINFNLIKNEIDKVLISKPKFEFSDLENISNDVEWNIFEIINLTLNLDLKNAILKLKDLNNFLDNPYLLYNMLVSNFRIYFYIFKLKDQKINSKEITSILQLWNRAFLVDKSFKIKPKNFYDFYFSLLNIDNLMKTWKLVWNESSDFLYELQKIFITKLNQE